MGRWELVVDGLVVLCLYGFSLSPGFENFVRFLAERKCLMLFWLLFPSAWAVLHWLFTNSWAQSAFYLAIVAITLVGLMIYRRIARLGGLRF